MIDIYDIRQAFSEMNEETKKSVLSQPEIDAVLVVRCKDCKYNTSLNKCLHPKSIIDIPKDDDFCSYAERKNND